MFKNEETPLKKSDLTRRKLFDIAIGMFAKEGFEQTTMRAIAQKAGIAPGGIYYHYDTKESLIHEYYQRSHDEHLERLGDFLGTEKDFAKRLHRVVASKIEVAEPYKNMSRALFRVAANPDSELSPFSRTSKRLRLESMKIFKEVVDGSQASFLPELKSVLPAYLWLYQMGIILYWIFDKSEGSKKTFEFIDRTVPLIEMLNQTLSSALAIPFRGKVVAILKSFTPDLGDPLTKEPV